MTIKIFLRYVKFVSLSLCPYRLIPLSVRVQTRPADLWGLYRLILNYLSFFW